MLDLPITARGRLTNAKTTLSSLLLSKWSDEEGLLQVTNENSSFDGIYKMAFLVDNGSNAELLSASENNEIFLSSLRSNTTRLVGKLPSFGYCDSAVIANWDRTVAVGSRTEGVLHLFDLERGVAGGGGSSDNGGSSNNENITNGGNENGTNGDNNDNNNGYSEIVVGDVNNGGHDFIWSVNRELINNSGSGNSVGCASTPFAVSFQQRREGEKAWFYDIRSKSSYSHEIPGPATTSTLFGATFVNSTTLLASHANSAEGKTTFRFFDIRNMTSEVGSLEVVREFQTSGYYGGLQSR